MPQTTTQRGYGSAHQRIRKQWEPIVEAGEADCHEDICLMPSRWIEPGSPWDLGHTPDGTAYIGPCHVRCNRSEGAARGNAQRSPAWRTSRYW